ncbi:protein kinase domain-containing protein [Cellulomonas iranensis]|uniref:protein kinase domain-containing protein n=1 Tax=Cellulomonas iranensis TaxID=76862 RepID=UPI003D7E5174
MDDDELWAPTPTRTTRVDVDLGLPGYTDLREVARGGDSVVYRAHQPALHRDVAIKVLLETDPATRGRFARELEITVRLGRQHPHVVTVLDTGTTAQGHPCLVMDFHDLGSLHDRLRSHGPLPVAEVVAAGTAVADALAFAHAHGVLHRDVKPQNVLLLPTSYVLTDFGIARMADAGHTASLERFSYRHASPQVLDGLEPTAADDVWSLGSTLSTLLDGRAPFAAPDPDDDTALGYLRRVRTGERRPVRRDDVPAALLAVVDRCLAPAREDRFASAADVHAALLALPTETRSWSPGGAPATPAPSPTDAARRAAAEAATPAGAAAAPAVDPAPGTGTPATSDAAPAAAPVAARGGTLPPLELPPVQPEDDRALAPSALSLLHAPVPAAVGADDEATGLHPAPPGLPPRTADAPDATAGGGRGGWVRVAAFVGGAILLGSAVGVGVTTWASARQAPGTAQPTPSPTPTAAEVPVREDPVPSPTGPLQPEVSDPGVTPTDLVAVDRGTSVELSWGDPTGGGATFVVVDPLDDPPRALVSLPAGATTYTVEGVDPQSPRVCLRVVAILTEDTQRRGISDEACVDR